MNEITEALRLGKELDDDGDLEIEVDNVFGETYIDKKEAKAIIRHLQNVFDI